MKNRAPLILTLLAALWLGAAGAAAPEKSLLNPAPAEGDRVLPMPNGLEMVFRPVRVPGAGFWGGAERLVQVGDATGGVFEGVQRTLIGGSFPSGDGNDWVIWIAKYELTKGQFLAVMGGEALAAASGDPEDAGLAQLKGRELRQALATPLSWVSHHAVQGFVHRYNQWLFDPAHPERRAALPTLDDAPGFIRLATEEEWEYTARGGLAALEQKRFEERLPFPARELNSYAWHLGNAKNRIRPIGLREPNELGVHDLYGNVHEMTAGLFRPELRQGKPGGIPVRGASVSTPANDVRASYRAEFDAFAWNPDSGEVEERRTFNVGARLAIGSNVVVNTRMREQLEREYEGYRQGLRRQTPAGQSLDTLVGQASTQLATVEPILARLAERYPDTRDQLLTVQSYLDTAKGRLDQAQRESARSLLQDVSRNGTNLSVYLTKAARLAGALESAKKLLAISTRYQAQVEDVERALAANAEAADEQYTAYLEKLARLGEYEARYGDEAFAAMGEKQLSPREAEVLDLARRHLTTFADRRVVDRDGWRSEFETAFAGLNE